MSRALLLLTFLLYAQDVPVDSHPVDQGNFTLHLIHHAIGEERYSITRAGDSLVLHATYETADRGNKRTLTADLRSQNDYSAPHLEIKGRPEGPVVIETSGPNSFVAFGQAPFAVQQAMMRYWLAHNQPAHLAVLRANSVNEPVDIQETGRDSITVGGKTIPLTRYTVANLVWGREVLWMNAGGQLAAAMTFAAGLPMEAVRTEYEPAFAQLVRAGVAEEMRTFSALERQAPREHSGSFAIAGAQLVDATGRGPVPDSVVLVRDGRIADAGSRAKVPIPKGLPVVNATGQTLLPGLWEMHSHFSGVEFGPAFLAAGQTTTRDCGGEFEFLIAARDAIEKHHAPGPRLLLAGLVDGGGPAAFGAITADTPEEARAVVAKYHAAGFQQLKLYTYLKPDVIAALAAEAHRVGMTVTGHVPAALNAFQGVEAGMDQINHLNYVSQMMRPPGGGRGAPIEIDSDQARKAIQFFRDHHTVVDPTASWGEMGGHPKDIDIASFEPGISRAPFTVANKFLSINAAGDAARFRTRMTETQAVIGALHKAGIPIVAGSDTGLAGYGLLRELEIYVQSGMTPLEAIQSATIVAARAMKLDADSGTVEAGKRADLILVDGDPLANIADLRKVSRVVANGRLYKTADLWKSVGFRP